MVSQRTGYEGVEEHLEAIVAADPEVIGQFVSYVNGKKVVDLAFGEGVDANDLVGIFSASKGASAMCTRSLGGSGIARSR